MDVPDLARSGCVDLKLKNYDRCSAKTALTKPNDGTDG
jgi:hypothetical protein